MISAINLLAISFLPYEGVDAGVERDSGGRERTNLHPVFWSVLFWLALGWEGVQALGHAPRYHGRQPQEQANYAELLRLILRKNSIYFSLGVPDARRPAQRTDRESGTA